MLAELFSTLQDIITGLLNALVSSTSGIIPIFYDGEEGFTIYGSLLLIGLGLFFVMFAWRVIQGFIRR